MATNLGLFTPNTPGGGLSPAGALSIPLGNTAPLLVERPFLDDTYSIQRTVTIHKNTVDTEVLVTDNFVALVAAITADIDIVLTDFQSANNTVEGYYQSDSVRLIQNIEYDMAAVVSYEIRLTVFVKIT
jgi:hypothetical protein